MKKIFLLRKKDCPCCLQQNDPIFYKINSSTKLGMIDEMKIFKYNKCFSNLKIKVIIYKKIYLHKNFNGREVYKKTSDYKSIQVHQICPMNIKIKHLCTDCDYDNDNLEKSCKSNNQYYLKIYDYKSFQIVYPGYLAKFEK